MTFVLQIGGIAKAVLDREYFDNSSLEKRKGEPMNFPIGAKTLLAMGVVAGGAVGTLALKNMALKRDEYYGIPSEILIGLAAALVGGAVGGDFGKALALGGAGGAALGITKLPQLAQLTGGGAAVAGWPYAVGELPNGGAVLGIPQGMQGAHGQQNLAHIAGLV